MICRLNKALQISFLTEWYNSSCSARTHSRFFSCGGNIQFYFSKAFSKNKIEFCDNGTEYSRSACKDWVRPVRALWMRNLKGQDRFWSEVCVCRSGPWGLSRALHCRGSQREAMQILEEDGSTALLGGCIFCLILSWLWITYLHNQLKKASERLFPGDVQSIARVSPSCFSEGKKRSLRDWILESLNTSGLF